MTVNTQDRLQDSVKHIADTLTNPDNYKDDYQDTDSGEPNAIDWLADCLDIRYIVSGNQADNFISAQVLVAFGGPNIWVNFDTKTVEGYWGMERATANFVDNLEVEDALAELWATQ